MSTQAIGPRRPDNLDERGLANTFGRLLRLTSDGVLVFDRFGKVLISNEAAAEMLGYEGGLVGFDLRDLFRDADVAGARGSFDMSRLPFSTDGSRVAAACTGANGRYIPMIVRCEPTSKPASTYLLVMRLANPGEEGEHEVEREINDLRRANHRLSGAMNIVLDTIDSQDVGTLFTRVLEEITETMEADGTLVYLAQSDGFHLRGISQNLEEERVPHFIRSDSDISNIISHDGGAMRLRVRAPSAALLRRGRLASREVVIEDNREVILVRSDILPPFTSFVFVPVWFDGKVIAFFEVGWMRLHPIPHDDAQLLESVAHYLSVQLVGAFSTLRMQRSEHLATLSNELREELMSNEGDKDVAHRLDDVMEHAAEGLNATCIPLLPDEHQAFVVADLPNSGSKALPIDLDALIDGSQGDDGVAVVDLGLDSNLHTLLCDLDEPCVGALVDVGVLGRHRRSYLIVRPDGEEPMDEMELNFLHELAVDARSIGVGQEVGEQDRRISEALQAGMKNELQDVEGITAQGIYSSATEAAFVGGDFYDLVSLPNRRACVIMGDVSGKGVSAASVASAVKTAIEAYSWEGLSPSEMVKLLNEFLLGFTQSEVFATLFVGVIDLAAGTVTYCSAGHPPAILMSSDGLTISILDVQSGLVGAFHDMEYHDGVVNIEAGEVLLLYTDGTTEARSPTGAFFGEQGLRDMVMRESGAGTSFDGFLDRLLATLNEFTDNTLTDDVSMVALRFDEVG